MVTVSVNKKWSTGEYTVTDSDSRDSYYTDDPEDAVNTAIAVVEDLQSKGKEAELSPAKYTRDIVAKYRSDWMMSQAQQAARKVMQVRPTEVGGTNKSRYSQERPQRLAEFEDIQDKLFIDHPDELDKVYRFLEKATGKSDPRPAMVVRRFQDDYPELYQSTMGREG